MVAAACRPMGGGTSRIGAAAPVGVQGGFADSRPAPAGVTRSTRCLTVCMCRARLRCANRVALYHPTGALYHTPQRACAPRPAPGPRRTQASFSHRLVYRKSATHTGTHEALFKYNIQTSSDASSPLTNASPYARPTGTASRTQKAIQKGLLGQSAAELGFHTNKP